MVKSPFDALNASDAHMQASPHVEATLRAEVRARAARRPRRWPSTALAIAASLAVLIGASSWLLRDAGRGDLPTPQGPDAAGEPLTGFLPLDYSRSPAGPTHIVRLEVPRTALASFGLLSMDSTGSPESDTVLADVIIGDDGLARAVRFVRPAAH
jgi:hypothetical protein